jgi:hypothetical protein
MFYLSQVKLRWTIVLLLLQRSFFPLSNSFSLGFLNLEYYASNLPDLYLDSLTHIHSMSLCYASLNFLFQFRSQLFLFIFWYASLLSAYWFTCFSKLSLTLTSFCQTIHFTYNHILTFSLPHYTSIFHLHFHSLQSFFALPNIAHTHTCILHKITYLLFN